jgi:glycine/D-amino acid oxidase-like deaminating enzyme/nitrite reductase/ring-hydroxylating ferredoxin subunit
LLEREQAAAQRIGLACERLEALPFATPQDYPCLRFPDQAQLHATKYLSGLLLAAIRRGVRVSFSTPVQRVEGGSLPRVKTRDGLIVTARAVVVATNSPINNVVALHTKQAPYTTYVLGVEVPRDTLPRGLFWDTLDPYHYLRRVPQENHDLILLGGADHKTGQFPETYGWDALETWGKSFLPAWGPIRYRWSGQVMETIDGLAFIGPDPGGQPNVSIITGDSGMGMTHGTLAGLLLQDQLRGLGHPWAALYDPSRKPLSALGSFVEENINVARQYLDWFTGSEVSGREQIPTGQGAVLRRGLSKVAIYHDEQGNWYECSAVCPHLGCIVRWNTSEKTWDCPCHGSRFTPTGKVIHGPAVEDLQRLASPPQDPAPTTN